MELTEGDVSDTCHTAAWLPLLPVHSTPASSPQAADREALVAPAGGRSTGLLLGSLSGTGPISLASCL